MNINLNLNRYNEEVSNYKKHHTYKEVNFVLNTTDSLDIIQPTGKVATFSVTVCGRILETIDAWTGCWVAFTVKLLRRLRTKRKQLYQKNTSQNTRF